MSENTGVEFKSMAENAAQNIMTCDANGVINYLNPESVKTLETIADILPIPIDEIVGASFDIFHKDPSYQQKLLKSPKRHFPRSAILDVSDEVKLDLNAAALFDNDGNFAGLQAVWSVATKRLQTEKDAALKTSMIEGAPSNLMTADLNGVITYINPAAERTLKSIETQLPCKVDEIVGQKFDIFHKDPSFQQGLLSDPRRNFPRNSILDYNGILLDLTAAALTDADGEVSGIQAAWSVVTDKVEAEREAALKSSMIEGAPSNLMTADLHGVVTYINPAAEQTLKSIEAQLPCKVNEIIGQKIDIFHKDPSFQQGLLSDPQRNFPRTSILDYNGILLDLTATALTDADGEISGIQAAWSVVTDKVQAEREAALKSSMVEGASINMMTCDIDGVITYLNPLSVKTLRGVESLLPCRVDEMVGKPFDIFHKDPSFQQNLLRDPTRNFPRTAILDYSGLKLDLTATVLYDNNGEAIGIQACWHDVTQKLAREAKEQEIAQGIKDNAAQSSSAASQLNASSQ